MTHLLVTNDFPPKIGGIQSYLWELWRRLPSDDFAVLTTPYAGDREFDAKQPFRIRRSSDPVLLPRRRVADEIETMAAEVGADLVVLDPALPLGLIGSRLDRPYAVIIHGAEVSVPSRLPGARTMLGRVLKGSALVVSGGHFALGEARRAAPGITWVLVPPGVDTERFRPLGEEQRAAARARAKLPADKRIVVAVSRLVPRKGIDILIAAASLLAPSHPDLAVAVAGGGRDRDRLEGLVRATGAPVRFLGRVRDDQLPSLLGAADIFAMPCRTRWGGLEQEGFGIVLLEAAACGLPQVAGDSGGAAEAVAHGETGFVVRDPRDPLHVADALAALLDDDGLRARMGAAARRRAETEFDYGRLAATLHRALQDAT